MESGGAAAAAAAAENEQDRDDPAPMMIVQRDGGSPVSAFLRHLLADSGFLYVMEGGEAAAAAAAAAARNEQDRDDPAPMIVQRDGGNPVAAFLRHLLADSGLLYVMESGGAAAAVAAANEQDIVQRDGGDPAAFQVARDHLAYQGRLLCVSPSSELLRLDYSQLGALASVEQSQVEIFTETTVSAGACDVAAWVLSRLQGVRSLLLLWTFLPPEWAVDVLLDAVASNPGAKIDRLLLRQWGEDSEAWLCFAGRFASGITDLEVGARCTMAEDAAEEVANSLRRQFVSLEKLTVVVVVQDFGSRRRPTNLLLRVLPETRATTLHLKVGGDFDEPYNLHEVLEELNQLSEAAIRSNSVKKLEVDVDIDCFATGDEPIPGYNVFSLLERWSYSESLEELTLKHVFLLNTSDLLHRRRSVASNNYSVKEITLCDTHVGPEGLSLLGRFKGVASINFWNVEIHGADATTPSLLNSLGDLSSFKFRCNGRNEDMAWIASNLRTASPKLRTADINLTDMRGGLRLPSLRDVLVNCSATVSLKLKVNTSLESFVPSLCEGIRDAQSLASFDLELSSTTWTNRTFFPRTSLAEILSYVQRNSVLIKFNLNASLDEESCPLIVELLSDNATLEYFGFDGSAANAGAAKFAIEGLRRNRRLKIICLRQFRAYVPLSAEISENLVAILQEHNTSLQRILGVSYESPEHEKRINDLLELNLFAPEFRVDHRRVPKNLWGGILNRIDKRECNEFVRKLAQRALNGSQADDDL
jgi:hypothetical protein